jgi:L-asparaginase
MDVTAEYLADAELEKTIVITGAMIPYSIDSTEATANLASTYGYITALEKEGVFIAMNGVMDSYKKVKKNRKEGRFTL